jgi:hypothetical protein
VLLGTSQSPAEQEPLDEVGSLRHDRDVSR